MQKEPIWVQQSVVLAIHNRQIAEHGGLQGIRDQALLESALGTPQNLYFYEDASLYHMAASYAYGIAKNHPFLDGNKRTAFVVCLLFLQLNGIFLQAFETEKYEVFIKLANGELSKEQLAQWLLDHSTPII
jgi:death-on-curing protein